MPVIQATHIPVRLFEEVDYKRAGYAFHPAYSVRPAPFVDSKAERVEGSRTMMIRG